MSTTCSRNSRPLSRRTWLTTCISRRITPTKCSNLNLNRLSYTKINLHPTKTTGNKTDSVTLDNEAEVIGDVVAIAVVVEVVVDGADTEIRAPTMDTLTSHRKCNSNTRGIIPMHSCKERRVISRVILHLDTSRTARKIKCSHAILLATGPRDAMCYSIVALMARAPIQVHIV